MIDSAQHKYIPYLSYIDICRTLCEHLGSPVIQNEPGYETFLLPMDCFYHRSFVTAGPFDPEAVAADLVRKIKEENYPKKLSFFVQDAPEDHEEIFRRAGFVPGIRQAAMYGCLDQLKPLGAPPKGEGRLITPDELEEWKLAMTAGFGRAQSAEPGLYEALYSIENVDIYGWFADGKIVGTMMAVENGDITGLHEGTVLPEYRRQGIITELILTGAKDFLPKGIRIASMQASAMGGPVYGSLGFKETGLIDTWFYQEESTEE